MKQKIRGILKKTNLEVATKFVWNQNLKFSERYRLVNILRSIHENKCSENVDYDDLDDLYSIISNIPQGKTFANKEELADFLADLGLVENLAEMPDALMDYVNDVTESVKSDYNIKDLASWKPSVYEGVKNLILAHCEANKCLKSDISEKMLEFKRNTLSTYVYESNGKDLHKMIYDVLDSNSIILIYGFIKGTYPAYTDKMRDEVYDFLSSHKNHPAYNMVAGAVDYSKVFENVNFKSIDVFDVNTNPSPFMIKMDKNNNLVFKEHKNHKTFIKSL